MKPCILFIKGVRDNNSVEVLKISNENLTFNVGGSSNLYTYIESESFNKFLLTLDAKANSSINTMGCRVLVNQISDFDTHKITLHKVSDLLKQLNGEVCCINKPEHIKLTTRDSISGLLQNINGLLVPKTIRIAPESPNAISDAIKKAQLNMPVLFRECGSHGGKHGTLLTTTEDINRLYAFALDGREYYLTEYHDYIENGVYKKYRIAVVDGKPYLRHLIISDHWMIHSRSRKFMQQHIEYTEEESQQLAKFDSEVAPVIQAVINRIYEKIKLDYFGIDCHINEEGELLIFEINATMNILLNNAETPNQWQQPVEKIKRAIIDMIKTRISAI